MYMFIYVYIYLYVCVLLIIITVCKDIKQLLTYNFYKCYSCNKIKASQLRLTTVKLTYKYTVIYIYIYVKDCHGMSKQSQLLPQSIPTLGSEIQ